MTDIDICNMALSTLGSATTVTSITPPTGDGSAAALYCVTFYPIARQEALETGTSWSFAKRRAALVATTNLSSVWTYAYSLPANCMTPVKVFALSAIQSPDAVFSEGWRPNESQGADFTIETNASSVPVLLTNEPDAELLYLVDQTDTTKWSTDFVVGVAELLASYLAGPIIRGAAGAKAKASLRENAMRMLEAAAANDGNSSESSTAEHTSSFIRARA